ncbi:MAG: hypothetical protein Kow0069_22940 [Promethearchaeota archaeon]
MKIKGVEKFRQKLPAFQGRKIGLLLLAALGAVVAAQLVLLSFDRLPLRYPSGSLTPAAFPLLGHAIVVTAAACGVWQLWFFRDGRKSRYGDVSYQRGVVWGMCGVAVVLSTMFHPLFPLKELAQGYWDGSPASFLVERPSKLLGEAGTILEWIGLAGGLVLFASGFLLVGRALQTFGIDYMAVVYLYFPEESEVQESEIYSALRHPTYGGAIRWSFAAALIRLTPYSLALGLLALLFFTIHVKLVEERELVRRFGDSYANYARETPAFFTRPRDLPKLVRFLLGRGKNDKAEPATRTAEKSKKVTKN